MTKTAQHKTEVKEKTGYKKTKLGWIPEEWEVKKVDDVFDFISTNSFSRKELTYESKETSVYNIHYGDIHSTFNEPILDYKKASNLIPVIGEDVSLPNETLHLKNGDVIMADASEDYAGVGATIELSNFNDVKVVAGLHTFALRDKSDLTSDGFRTYIFKHPVVSKSIKVIATGSKVYGISKTNLAKIDLILPPLPEQQKIAAILSMCDEQIALQTQLIHAKEQQKKGLMQQLLTGEVRFDGFDEEWEEVRLGEVGEIINGLTYSPEDVVEKGLLVLRSSNIQNDQLSFHDNVYVKHDNADFNPVKEKDVLICVRNGSRNLIGKNVIIPKELEGVAFGAFMTVYRSQFNDYISQVFNSDIFKKSVQMNLGATINSINNNDLKKYKIPLPSLQEQQKIASVLSAADEEIALLKKELSAMQEQKKGLMQVLLTGELRVPSV